VVAEVRKFTDESDDRILEYCLFWVNSPTVFAYCLHNRFVTHEQHSGDFFKLKNPLHCVRILGLYMDHVTDSQHLSFKQLTAGTE
jgi:hypothetical protein